MNKILTVVVIAVVAVIGGWLISKRGQNQVQAPAASVTNQASPAANLEKAPDFHLQDYSGKTVSLADFSGKPLVINSWASWCPFCRQELPDLVTAQKEFGNKIAIIAVNRVEPLAVAKGYTDQQGTSGKLIFLLDPGDSFYQSIDGFSMPETIFVDKNGNIVDHKRGPMSIEEIRQKISKVI